VIDELINKGETVGMREVAAPRADGSGEATVFAVLTVDEIEALSAEDRADYIQRLLAWEYHNDVPSPTPLDEWHAHSTRCTHSDGRGERCRSKRWDGTEHCISHATYQELTKETESDRRRRAAKLRTLDLADDALDRLQEILEAPSDEVSPQVRLKAISEVLDRSGVIRETATSVEVRADVTAEVTHRVAPSEVIRDRLAALQQDELDGIAHATDLALAPPPPPEETEPRDD
jgi:hypothetical protein